MLKYRVYIIDEVHMMSGAAFNALLKTLEEPPSYVVFILATTEYNKLPTTIVSRCQRFDFRRMSSDIIIERLKKISDAEGIDLGEDGARLIARASRGGMRDAVSLLELCAGSRAHINAELVASTIGTGDRGAVYKLIEAIGCADHNTVYTVVRDVVMSSGDISVFWQEIIDSCRDIMIVKNTDKAKSYLDLTDVEFEMLKKIAAGFSMARLSYHTTILENALADMQRAVNSKRSIAEIALTRMCDPKLVLSAEALAVRVEELEKQISMMRMGIAPSAATAHNPVNQGAADNAPAITPQPTANKQKSDIPVGILPYDRWNTVLERIGELKRSLASQFVGASAFKDGDGGFIIRMREFFANRILANASDFAILCGVIAEIENRAKEDVNVKIEGISAAAASDPASELENLFN